MSVDHIINPERAKQAFDFGGMTELGNIHATDIDGAVDIKGRGYIFL